MNFGTDRFYKHLRQELMNWVWNNPRLLHKITKRDLEYLFEFDPQRGLSINLRRFELEFYKETFYPPEKKKRNIDEFVRKVCGVIHQAIAHSGRTDLTITITVRHLISEVSHWKTFYIDQNYKCKELKPLIKKEQDWYYRFDSME